LDCGRLDRSDHRLVAGEMQKSLGQTIVIINQSGSIGTRSALEATTDGSTWTAGAAQDPGAWHIAA
jgi:tripartite-type tricarboxylate transporter receptor subunit TctC